MTFLSLPCHYARLHNVSIYYVSGTLLGLSHAGSRLHFSEYHITRNIFNLRSPINELCDLNPSESQFLHQMALLIPS